MTKQEAYNIVLEDLKRVPLYCGKFDEGNGNPHFMFGINTVMEHIAEEAGDEVFDTEFIRNFANSFNNLKKNKEVK